MCTVAALNVYAHWNRGVVTDVPCLLALWLALPGE
jgi:hypothetical protein